jgi:threonine 3-dehydrogenase
MFETWCKMAGVVPSGLHLTPIIHHLPKERFREGFDRMKSGESGKIILDRA